MEEFGSRWTGLHTVLNVPNASELLTGVREHLGLLAVFSPNTTEGQQEARPCSDLKLPVSL